MIWRSCLIYYDVQFKLGVASHFANFWSRFLTNFDVTHIKSKLRISYIRMLVHQCPSIENYLNGCNLEIITKNSPVMCWGGLSKMSKKMWKCQKDVKCQTVKQLNNGGGSQKINWPNEVHIYWYQFWRHIWRSSKLVKNNFYWHFEGFWWASCVTSKLTSRCVNLIMSISFFFVNLLHSRWTIW